MNLLGDQNQTTSHLDRERSGLLSAVNENPGDAQAVFNLAESYFNADDFVHARFWHARRAEMGGAEEEVFVSLLRFAQSMHKLGEPWADVLDAYLRAWEYRPTRAEPLYRIANGYRLTGDYLLGYLFAERAAQIPRPNDVLEVSAEVYEWAAILEQGICASWISKKPESFALFRKLLSMPGVPAAERAQLADYCEFLTPDMLLAASDFPQEVIEQLAANPNRGQADTTSAHITVAFAARHDRAATERTINSFLNCCTDISAVNRFLLVDSGLADVDRTSLLDAYPFLELAARDEKIGRFLLRLEAGWEFFTPGPLIRRLTAVFDAEPNLVQIAVNYADAHVPTQAIPEIADIRTTPDGQRYVLTNSPATCPVMLDTTRTGSFAAQYATLDEVVCVIGTGN